MRLAPKVSTIVLVALVLIGACHGCLEHERNALLQLFSYFNIDYSSLTMNTTNCCGVYSGNCGDTEGNTTNNCYQIYSWVLCNHTEGRVSGLDLESFESQHGRIGDLYLNTSLFLPFEGLRSLRLAGFGIVGCAENEGFQRLSRLENLEYLDLKFNLLNNSILSLQGLCELRHLRYLSLSNNDLSGSLPSCLANLTSLQSLDLSFNQISADIGFSPIKSMTSLRSLDLTENRFNVPTSLAPFFNHSKLTYLYIQGNELYAQTEGKNFSPKFQLEALFMSSPVRTAAYPNFLYHQSSLQSVDLSHIQIMGEFPYWLLENNTNLAKLVLSNNSLSGPFQLPIHPHMSLSTLDISRNSIRGHIPSEFGAHFPLLKLLSISTNALTGSIPLSLGMLTSLIMLDLSNNRLSGEIAEGLFMGMTRLELLKLGGNQITGNIPDSLSFLSFLTVLDISHNNLSGNFPGWIGNSEIDVLDLSENNLSGALPTNFCPPSVTQLKLSNNKLFGSLTKAFCYCSRLTTLDLGHNHFTGNIPEWIGGCSQLQFLLLSHNYLQGKIPIELCALDQLNLIDLSNNNLTGHILPCLMSHSNFDIQKENDSSSEGARIPAIAFAPDTSPTIAPGAFAPVSIMASPSSLAMPPAMPPIPIEGQRPLEFTAKSLSNNYQASILKYISGIDLSCNNLTGEIAPEIGNLSEIQVLNLSHNSLTGPIPLMFENLKQIESLDLSYNKLYGKIPPQLTELNFLSDFNVAHNNLSGRTPEWVGQFATFNESSYEGNPLLCGLPLPKRCNEREPPSLSMPRTTTEEESEEDNGFIDMEAFYVSFLIAYIMVLLVIAAVLYINPYWRRLLFGFIEDSTTKFYYFLLDNLPFISKFGLS